ncbi:MAG: hypothetical protein AB7V57_16075, partial [Verrucomicrobiales bacterium]
MKLDHHHDQCQDEDGEETSHQIRKRKEKWILLITVPILGFWSSPKHLVFFSSVRSWFAPG